MKRIWLSVAVTVAAACAKNEPAPGLPAEVSAKLDAAVADAFAKREMPGGSLVVVQGDRIVYGKGFGAADLAARRPYTDSTPTVIGSTSKPLTALAVLRLVQLGKVALDTPITRYVPELAFTDGRAKAITLRHLLTNRSGLPAGFSGPAYQQPPVQDSAALGRLAAAMTQLPLGFAPGEGYTYSNRGWALAGYVVQRVSGEPIEGFLKREVFLPLGMTGTTLEFWKVPNLVHGYAEGRLVRNIPHRPSITREYGPAGMIVSTPRDMGRLLVAMMNRGKTVDGTQFLTPDLIDEALRGQAKAESELGGPTTYALGWEVDSMLGTLTIKKAGSVHTMVSLWVMLPDRKTAMAFTFNREDYQVLGLLGTVAKILAGGQADPFPASAVLPPVVVVAPVRISAAVLDRWVGSYDTRIGDLVVSRRGNSLVADYQGSDVGLAPASDSSFIIQSDAVADGGQTMTFRRLGKAVTVWIGPDSSGIRR